MLGIAMRRRAARKTDADEESLIDFRLALGGVASRSAGCYLAEPATVGRSERPIRSNQTPNDRCFLHRGDDRDILQRTQRPERRWLRVKGRVHVKQWGWIERRVCIRWRRWGRQFVHAAMRKRAAIQRTVQLTKQANQCTCWVSYRNPLVIPPSYDGHSSAR